MPDREFEIYLSVLSRLLHLKPGQRDEIADELRDHLEERLAELTAEGVSQDAACRRALDELGDAAGLAAQFTHIAKRKSRRLIMRWTVGTILTACVVAVLANAFWPEVPEAPAPPMAAAQPGQNSSPAGKAVKPQKTGATKHAGDAASPVSQLEKKLAQPVDDVLWEEASVEQVLKSVATEIKTDILIDKSWFEENGYDPGSKITLVVGYAKISARTVLELVLERAGMTDVAITFRDGLIYLTNPENDRAIDVYNCRDLLQASVSAPSTPGQPAAAGGGFFSVQSGFLPANRPRRNKPASTPADTGFGGNPGLGAPGGLPKSRKQPQRKPAGYSLAAQRLIGVIQTTVTSTAWADIDGTGAQISEFNGLLVITASAKAHRDIQQLLEKLREANRNARHKPRKKYRPGHAPPTKTK